MKDEGRILAAMELFNVQMREYLERTYDRLDAHILEDVFSSMVKSFANLTGVFVAVSMLTSPPGGRLQDLSSELGEGTIGWEKRG